MFKVYKKAAISELQLVHKIQIICILHISVNVDQKSPLWDNTTFNDV